MTVTINADGVFINNAKVTVADLLADNGVVHVIDAVLLPPSASNDVNGTSAVTIYPNPSVRGLTIESKSRETIKARLIDLFGREIEKASSEGIINLSFDQIPGTYLLEVQEGVSKISIHRVVKL
ncbi:MAG: T9SS type A sorting domain-containing protein [Saprospiraceae bacterium]|nr:T9SS type A sorting domain-containing protein [Saprospiraceae bacterium]